MNSVERLRGITINRHPRTAYRPSLAYYGLLVAKVTIATRRDEMERSPLELSHDYPKASRG